MANNENINDSNEYEKIIKEQAAIIKGFKILIDLLPPTLPTVVAKGLLGDAQTLAAKVSLNPQDEKERRQLFGARVKMVRQMLGLTRVDLAKKMNVSIPLIAAYETGQREPSIKNLIALTKILNVSADWLLDIPPPQIIANKNATA